MHRLDNNIKKELKEIGYRVWIGFFCPRIQHSGDLF
jgi:hypothetical protein